MLKSYQLNKLEDRHFQEVWKLYEMSFPKEEKRNISEQKVIFKDERYCAQYFWEDDTLIALLFYWQFDEYAFVEHFVINALYRGKSYGSKILRDFLQKHKKIFLEIEPVCDVMSEKRFHFYKRLGFVKNELKHYQVPFREGAAILPLTLLSFPQKISSQIYKNLYQKMQQALFVAEEKNL